MAVSIQPAISNLEQTGAKGQQADGYVFSVSQAKADEYTKSELEAYYAYMKNKATESGENPANVAKIENAQNLKCDVCSVCYDSWKTLKRHLRSHTDFRPFKCNLCPKAFFDLNKLKRHLLTHTGVKPYACHICDQKVSRPEHLRRHLLVHSDDRPYRCQICDFSARRTDSVRSHQKSKHPGQTLDIINTVTNKVVQVTEPDSEGSSGEQKEDQPSEATGSNSLHFTAKEQAEFLERMFNLREAELQKLTNTKTEPKKKQNKRKREEAGTESSGCYKVTEDVDNNNGIHNDTNNVSDVIQEKIQFIQGTVQNCINITPKTAEEAADTSSVKPVWSSGLTLTHDSMVMNQAYWQNHKKQQATTEATTLTCTSTPYPVAMQTGIAAYPPNVTAAYGFPPQVPNTMNSEEAFMMAASYNSAGVFPNSTFAAGYYIPNPQSDEAVNKPIKTESA